MFGFVLCPHGPKSPIEFFQLRKTRSFRQIIFWQIWSAKVGFFPWENELPHHIVLIYSSCKAKFVSNYPKQHRLKCNFK
jgi:hypothetical protein